ncbi:MAG: Gfo/Idh/MocA family oxidoreductase [Acidobacteria bacterium]|nr:Gfo/Idh/MocA family oxidoreductase [Acidobacteriota bacterium]
MPDQPFGAGIIGTAHSHAVGHLRTIHESGDYHLVAAAEPNPELLARAKANEAWQGVTWVSPEALLADPAIQVVCIETDPLEALHWSLRSIEAGKHTKIDKPPGVDYELLKKIFAEAERRHLLIQMGYVYRYNPAFRLAHRAIHEGWLGPVRSVLCQMNDTLDAAGRLRLNRYPGGQMFEICCHMIDALLWLMGEPKRVSPTLRHSDPVDDGLEDDVMATFEFDPALAVVKSNTRNGDRYFYVFGEKGSIQIESPDRPKCRLALSEPHGEFEAGIHDVPIGPSPRYRPDMDDLAAAIRERRQVEYFTPEHDLMVQRTLLRACGVEVESD